MDKRLIPTLVVLLVLVIGGYSYIQDDSDKMWVNEKFQPGIETDPIEPVKDEEENSLIISPETGEVESDFCEVDSDCEVKNVGNCCGYYPACVNKDYEPDLEAVKRECEEKGMASICGWSDIDECKCVENRCKSLQDGNFI